MRSDEFHERQILVNEQKFKMFEYAPGYFITVTIHFLGCRHQRHVMAMTCTLALRVKKVNKKYILVSLGVAPSKRIKRLHMKHLQLNIK